jgi:hypothetical protein
MPPIFGRYQSGIEAATGNLVPAYGKMAEQTANALTGLGQNIAAGIERYGKNRDESEMIDQEAQGIGEQLKQYAITFGSNDEYKPFTEQLNQYVDKLSKIPEMSLAQKRGALNGAKVAFSNIGNQLQMFNAMKTMNEERAAADAMRPENNPVSEVQDTVLPMALNNFDFSKPYLGNEAGYSASLDNLAKQGANIDKPAKLEEYRKRVEEAATEMSKTNPMGLTILDQVNAARKLDAATSPDTEGYSEAEQAIRTPAEQKSSVAPESLKSYFKASDIETELQSVQEKIKQYNLKDAQGGNRVPALGEETIGKFIDEMGATLGYGAKGLEGNEAVRTYVQGLKASAGIKGQIGDKSIEQAVRDFYKKDQESLGLASSLNIVNEFAKGMTLGISAAPAMASEAGRGFQPLSSNEEKAIVEASRKIVAEGAGNVPSETLERLKTREKQLNNRLLTVKGSEQLVNQTQATLANAPKPNQMALEPIDVVVPQERPVAPEIRNQKAIDFMTQRLGYRDANGNLVTPASVNRIFGDMGTGGVKTINLPNGGQVIKIPNDKGGYDNQYIKPEDKSAQTKTAELSTYGVQDPKSGKLLYEEPIKGLGVMIRGTGKFPTDKDAGNFKDKIAKAAMVVDAMKRVKQIAKEHPIKTKLPWTDAQVDIIGEQSKAIAALKEILALDRLSDKDVEIIMKRIPSNDSWMRTASQTDLQADNVIKDVQNLLYNLGTIYKLDVSVKGQSNSKGGNSTVKELKKELNR